MVNAQEWLDANYSKENRSKITEIYISEQLSDELELSDFSNLEKIFISYLVDKNKFEIANKKKETKLIQLKNAQQWLDQRYPIKNANPARRRNKVERLDIDNKDLEGVLDLTDFINLKKLCCNDNKLTALKLNNLSKLESVFCFNNQLTNLETSGLNNLEWLNSKINNLTDLNSLLSNLNSIKLKQLDLRNNKFSESDLSPLSKFTNLESLEITNNFSQQGKNNFYKSLKSLQSSTNLKSLHVVDSASDKFIYCSSNPKDGSVISQIKKLTKFNQEWLDNNYPLEQRSKIKEIHLNESSLEGELDLGEFTHEDGVKVYISLEVDASKLVIKNLPVNAEIIETIQAQKYVDQQYPTPSAKANCQELNLRVKSEGSLSGTSGKLLTGSLSLKGFTNLKGLACDGQKITSLDLTDNINLEVLRCKKNQLTNLSLSFCSKLKILVCSENQLTELEVKTCFDLEEFFCECNQLTHLDLKNQTKLIKLCYTSNQLTELNVGACSNLAVLKGGVNKLTSLDLTNCSNLTELYCGENQLTNLTLPPKLPNLEKLICRDNLLTNLDFSTLNKEKLTVLNLINNNFSEQDLTSLVGFINLKELVLGNRNQTKIQQSIYNRWTGSLQPLQNMKQLQELNIDNTDLTSGTEYLPPSIMQIDCSYLEKTDSEVKLIVKELKKSSDFISIKSFSQIYFKKKLNSELLSQIKDFNHKVLTSNQETLLEKLITGKAWREHYKKNGLCANCQQLNGDSKWCQSCEVQKLQADFPNWTSGNLIIDKFIQKCQLEATNLNNILEWIPYEEFTNVKHLTEGGFGQVYKASWTKNNALVALKSLTNSQHLTSELLAEIIHTKLADGSGSSLVVRCHGISQDPQTKNYVMVMHYMSKGNLREYLSKNYQQLNFENKLQQLNQITQGLCSIHEANLIHQDFHSGNVLNDLQNNYVFSLISDLGLSRPVSEAKQGKLYGVLPYVAPEILKGEPYTQSSDIYSFGIMTYELLTNTYPYADLNLDDTSLALKICQGLRPNLEQVRTPQLLKDLIIRCWDAEPGHRPSAAELFINLSGWLDENFFIKKNTEFYYQYQTLKNEYTIFSQNTPYKIHPTATLTSKPINTKEIVQLFQESENQALEQELKKIEKEIKQTFTDELKELVSDFIQTSKITIKDKENEEAEDKIWDLEDKLKEKNLSEEKINEITRYCERFIKAERELEKERLETNIEIPTNQ